MYGYKKYNRLKPYKSIIFPHKGVQKIRQYITISHNTTQLPTKIMYIIYENIVFGRILIVFVKYRVLFNFLLAGDCFTVAQYAITTYIFAATI